MTPAQPITVLLAEDHVIVRQGIRALLKADGYFTIVGEARTGREAVAMAKALRPDVILMDIAMPVLNGLEATRQILAADPTAKVVILSAHCDEMYLERSRAVGVAAFLNKVSSAEMLIKAIREVAQGKTFFSPEIAKRLHTQADRARGREGLSTKNATRLTSREAEVLQLVAEGSANKHIAVQLGINVKTVEKHRQTLMDKLNIHDIAGLTRYAIAAGVIEGSV
jgi:DNA-binding NarL/FixJ family response regulator